MTQYLTTGKRLLSQSFTKKVLHRHPLIKYSYLFTCIACNAKEHIVLSNINKHLENLNIINEKQHGLRSGIYCTPQRILSINDLASELDT